jgi:hypothetical protein
MHAQLSQLVPLLLRSSTAAGPGDNASAPRQSSFVIDSARLAAFGGAQELVRHFRAAASPNAQRSILLPLLQHCMPAGIKMHLALLSSQLVSSLCVTVVNDAQGPGVHLYSFFSNPLIFYLIYSWQTHRPPRLLVRSRRSARHLHGFVSCRPLS